jgi:hypothetical protein
VDPYVGSICGEEYEIDGATLMVVIHFVPNLAHIGCHDAAAIGGDCGGLIMKSNPSPPLNLMCDVDESSLSQLRRSAVFLDNQIVGLHGANSLQFAAGIGQIEDDGASRLFSTAVCRMMTGRLFSTAGKCSIHCKLLRTVKLQRGILSQQRPSAKDTFAKAKFANAEFADAEFAKAKFAQAKFAKATFAKA